MALLAPTQKPVKTKRPYNYGPTAPAAAQPAQTYAPPGAPAPPPAPGGAQATQVTGAPPPVPNPASTSGQAITSPPPSATNAPFQVPNPAYLGGPYFSPAPGSGNGPANSPQSKDAAAHQAALLGDLWNQINPGGKPYTRGDIPLLGIALNFQQLQHALANQGTAADVLRGAGLGIGQSPESQFASQNVMDRLKAGGPFTPQLLDQLMGNIRNQAGVGLQANQRTATAGLAQRGLGGSLPALAMARLQQQSNLGTQGNLAQLSQTAATTNDEASRQNWSQLNQLASEQERNRLSISDALAKLFGETQFAPIDLSSLTQKVPNSLGFL